AADRSQNENSHRARRARGAFHSEKIIFAVKADERIVIARLRDWPCVRKNLPRRSPAIDRPRLARGACRIEREDQAIFDGRLRAKGRSDEKQRKESRTHPYKLVPSINDFP